jgi:hypothetical protein
VRNTGTVIRTVDMSGVSNAQLTFYWKANGLENGDYGRVLVSDGSQEIEVLEVTDGQDDNSWNSYTYNIPSSLMSSSFQIKIEADGNNDNDRFFIDELEITGYQ